MSYNSYFNTDNVDSQVDIFINIFHRCLNACAPLVTKRVRRPFAPWMTDDIKSIMKKRNIKQRMLKRDRRNVTLENEYKDLKVQVISRAKKEYYNTELMDNSGDVAATWRVVRQLVPGKPKNNDCLPIAGKIDQLNSYFVNVGKNAFLKSQQDMSEDIETPKIANTTQVADLFRPQPTDINTIVLTIKQLKDKKSCGSDGIALRFLRDALPVIAPYLTCIINTSIVTGEFPTTWKHAIITPVYKSGSTDDPCNYRPISLLPILSKLLEKNYCCTIIKFLRITKFAQHHPAWF